MALKVYQLEKNKGHNTWQNPLVSRCQVLILVANRKHAFLLTIFD